MTDTNWRELYIQALAKYEIDVPEYHKQMEIYNHRLVNDVEFKAEVDKFNVSHDHWYDTGSLNPPINRLLPVQPRKPEGMRVIAERQELCKQHGIDFVYNNSTYTLTYKSKRFYFANNKWATKETRTKKWKYVKSFDYFFSRYVLNKT